MPAEGTYQWFLRVFAASKNVSCCCARTFLQRMINAIWRWSGLNACVPVARLRYHSNGAALVGRMLGNAPPKNS